MNRLGIRSCSPRRWLARGILLAAAIALAAWAFHASRRAREATALLQAQRDLRPAPGAGDAREYTYFIFNTTCRFVFTGPEKDAQQAAGDAQRICQRLHDTLNYFDPSSELSRLNAAPADTPFACSDLMWEAILAARRAWRLTDGAFDVTVGPLMALWRRHAADGTTPAPDELAAVRQRVGFQRLSLDETARTVTKTADGMRLDFNGLAKGLALDLARTVADRPAFTACLLDFGGNLYLRQPDGAPGAGQVAIRPLVDGDAPLAILAGCNHRFIATSSNAERPLADGKRPVGHILSPATGLPVEACLSATAVTASGADSDALSTAVFVGGPALAQTIARRLPRSGFAILSKDADAPVAIGDLAFAKDSR